MKLERRHPSSPGIDQYPKYIKFAFADSPRPQQTQREKDSRDLAQSHNHRYNRGREDTIHPEKQVVQRKQLGKDIVWLRFLSKTRVIPVKNVLLTAQKRAEAAILSHTYMKQSGGPGRDRTGDRRHVKAVSYH
jgi:hypothetical protein